MAISPLPVRGSTDWFTWASDIDAAARKTDSTAAQQAYVVQQYALSADAQMSADVGTPAFAAPAKFGSGALRGGNLQISGKVPQPTNSQSPLTLEMWIRLETHTPATYVLGSLGTGQGESGFWMGVENNDKLIVTPDGNQIINTIAISNNVWHHIAVQLWSNANKNVIDQIWVDGVPQLTTAVPSVFNTPWNNIISVGTLLGSPQYLFPGGIDEYRITQGVRYIGTFTPPASQLTWDSRTLILAHLDDKTATTLAGYSYPPRPAVPAGNVTYKGSSMPTDMQTYDTWDQI